jgi:hypothetical protein
MLSWSLNKNLVLVSTEFMLNFLFVCEILWVLTKYCELCICIHFDGEVARWIDPEILGCKTLVIN